MADYLDSLDNFLTKDTISSNKVTSVNVDSLVNDWSLTSAKISNLKVDTIDVSPTGYIRSWKTSFTDSVHVWWYESAEGIYFGGALDVTKFKFTVLDGSIDLIGTISSRSTATLAAAINSSGNLVNDIVNVRLNSSSKAILSDFNFGATDYAGAVKSGDITWNTTTWVITWWSWVVVYRWWIVGANAGVTTFSINSWDGSAYFKWDIAALSGYFGNVTNWVSVWSNGLNLIGSWYIRTWTTGARVELVRSITWWYSHGLAWYDSSNNLLFRLTMDGGNPIMSILGNDTYSWFQITNASSTFSVSELKISLAWLEHWLEIVTSGNTARSTKSWLYINNQAVYWSGLNLVNGTDSLWPLISLTSNNQEANLIEILDTSLTATHPARITNRNYIQFPAYYHCSDFDELASGDVALSSSVVAKSYWVGWWTSGTQTLVGWSNEDENTYIKLSTTSTASRTSTLTFGRFIAQENQWSFECRMIFNDITNTNSRWGFYLDASNYVTFSFDTDLHASRLYIGAKSGWTGSDTQLTQTISASTWYLFRISIIGSVATFYLNDVAIGTLTGNIPSSHCKPYFYISNKAASEEKILYIDYEKHWTGRDDTSSVS